MEKIDVDSVCHLELKVHEVHILVTVRRVFDDLRFSAGDIRYELSDGLVVAIRGLCEQVSTPKVRRIKWRSAQNCKSH